MNSSVYTSSRIYLRSVFQRPPPLPTVEFCLSVFHIGYLHPNYVNFSSFQLHVIPSLAFQLGTLFEGCFLFLPLSPLPYWSCFALSLTSYGPTILFLFLLLVVTCSHSRIPREMAPLLWHCPFLGEMCSVLLCYDCDYCLWIHTWTHSLHLFTPGKSDSDFQFMFTFFSPPENCFLDLLQFCFEHWVCSSFSLAWAPADRGSWLCLCALPSGISSDAHLGPWVHPCLCALHFEQQPSEHTSRVSSSVCCLLS